MRKEMYTREEVKQFVISTIQEKISKHTHESPDRLAVEAWNIALDHLNKHDMFTSIQAKTFQVLLEKQHKSWVDFYNGHYSGLQLMNRIHDQLTYYYEAYYYFCRPGTYTISLVDSNSLMDVIEEASN